MVERGVGQAGEVGDRLVGELGDVSAGGCSSEGPRCSPQQCLVLRPEPHGQGWLRPGPGIGFLLGRLPVRVAFRSVGTGSFRPVLER